MPVRALPVVAGLVAALCCPPAASPKELPQAARDGVQQFLAAQADPANRSTAQSESTALVDLDADGTAEVVVLWSTVGGTDTDDHLTVLRNDGAVYRPAGSVDLNGQAKLSGVGGGRIEIEQLVHGPNDPACCPTRKKKSRYRLGDGTLVPAK